MSPGHKCQIAGIFVNRGLCSERAACRHFGLHRSTFQYEAKQPNAWLARLKIALKRMSRLHPELGYSKITRLLKDEGWQVGNRMVQRLRRELGLAVPTRKPRRRRQGISTGLPTKATHPNHVWTWDFVHDTTMRGGKLRMLTVLDEYTRESRCIHVDRKINAEKVQRVMARLIEEYGVPESVATMVLSLSKRTCASGYPVRESRLCISNRVVLGKMDTSRASMLASVRSVLTANNCGP